MSKFWKDIQIPTGIVLTDPNAIYQASAKVTGATFGPGFGSAGELLGRFSTMAQICVVQNAYQAPEPGSPPLPKIELRISILANLDMGTGTAFTGVTITGLDWRVDKLS